MIKILTKINKFYKCQNYKYIKQTTDKYKDLFLKNLPQNLKFLQLNQPSLTFTAVLSRSLNHFPQLLQQQQQSQQNNNNLNKNKQIWRIIKESIRRNKINFTPYSCLQLSQNIHQFQFDGDQNDIFQLLGKFADLNRYYFLEKDFNRFLQNFKGLAVVKAHGPINFPKAPSKHSFPINDQLKMLFNGISFTPEQKKNKVRNVVIDQQNNKIIFQRKRKNQDGSYVVSSESGSSKDDWIKIKIFGIPSDQIKKIQVRKKHGMINDFEYNEEIEKIMAEFLVKFKKALQRNSQCLIYQADHHGIDNLFKQNQFILKDYWNFDQFSSKNLKFSQKDLKNYLINFKKTQGLVYKQDLTEIKHQQDYKNQNDQQSNLIDPYRSLLLHMHTYQEFHKQIFIIKADTNKSILRHFYDLQSFPLNTMENVFAYYRLIQFHQQIDFCVKRENDGCLPLPRDPNINRKIKNTKKLEKIYKSLHKKQIKCCDRQKKLPLSLIQINQNQGKLKYFMNKGQTFGQEVDSIINNANYHNKNKIKSFVIICQKELIWDVFKKASQNKSDQNYKNIEKHFKKRFSKQNQNQKQPKIKSQNQNLSQRLAILKCIYEQQNLQDTYKELKECKNGNFKININKTQVQNFYQKYKKLIYPINLWCN